VIGIGIVEYNCTNIQQKREGLETTLGAYSLQNVFNMINVLLPNLRSSIGYTGRSSGRARDGSFNGRKIKKENECSSKFERMEKT